MKQNKVVTLVIGGLTAVMVLYFCMGIVYNMFKVPVMLLLHFMGVIK